MGSVEKAHIGQRTAKDVLESQQKLSPDVIAARVDGKVYDLHTPLPGDAVKVEPIAVDHPDALPIIRHSTSHVMADAVQKLFPGTKVAFGPATEAGFYYDYDRPDGSFTEEDLRRIERKMEEIVGKDHEFRREVMSGDEVRKLLRDMGETYKLEHAERLLAQGETISVYRHGDWVDLCEGPHVPSTRFLKAFQLTTVAGAYWRGDERNPMLQRIDVIAFHPWAPASPFFLPRGAKVYNALVEYVRDLYLRHEYDEVITPQIFDRQLFVTSGHLPSYLENMFMAATPEDVGEGGKVTFEDVRFGVKPMNCPSHCVIFGMTRRSYRELPWRMADFGRLHRYERSGVVQGLTRVRSFAQDDAHIFCTMEQLQGEIVRFIRLVYEVYEDFGFRDVRVVVATRPEKRIGSDEVWDRAERALEEGVTAAGVAYDIAEGEGAFYGPKVEFHLKDAIGRPWQLGTIQADFNMPERFDLTYVAEDNQPHRPVMLHRAILGSVERFYGVLVEHVGGAFPTWLAPEQVSLLTVSERFNEYANRALEKLRAAGIRATADLSGDKLGAKIRQARLMRIPYLGVIGEKEQEAGGLAVRSRDENADLGLISLDAFVDRIHREGIPPSQRGG